MTARPFAFLVLAALAIGLTACETANYPPNHPKQTAGTVGGAVLGGLAGSQMGKGTGQLWATGAGVLLGALIGSEVGRSLDRADQQYMQQAAYRANTAPLGEPISWNNPDSGNSGVIVPVRDGTSASGRYCREYQQSITVNGETQKGYGTACRQPDGSWEILS